LLIVGGIVALGFILAAVNQNARDKAKAAYQTSLDRLKLDPGNADLRHQTLQLGRIYSNLTRNNKGVTLFDEVALLNDINAACGFLGGPVAPPVAPSVTGVQPSIEERLTRLDALKNRGLISEAEFESKRSKLLDEV